MRPPTRPRNEPRTIVPRHAQARRLRGKRPSSGKAKRRVELCAPASSRRSLESEAPYVFALHRNSVSASLGNNAWLDQYASSHFLSSASQITRLMDLPFLDRRPDEHAHAGAHRMLVHLNDLHFNVPASDIYADPDRAIRLLWTQDERNVEVVFPSGQTEVPYLYHSDDSEYGVEETVTAESVLHWLQWVLSNASPEHIRAA